MKTLRALLLLAPSAIASAGPLSGTTSFNFTSFDGAYSLRDANYTANPYMTGLTTAGFGVRSWNGPYTRPIPGTLFTYSFEIGTGTATFEPGVSEVKFGETGDANTYRENVIGFTPSNYTDVDLGKPFKIGTIFYQNGNWPGGTPDPNDPSTPNIPSNFHFTLCTDSNVDAYDLCVQGIIRHVVNAPFPAPSSPEARADWITVESGASVFTFADFKVDDATAGGPAQFGSVDVMAQFGSLHLLGFSNPVGGYLAPNAVPVGSTLQLLGLSLVGLGAIRRKRG